LHLNEERKKVGRNKRSGSGLDDHAGNGLRPYPGLRKTEQNLFVLSLGQSGRWQSEYHDAMIDHDKDVGELLNLLDELGIVNDTIAGQLHHHPCPGRHSSGRGVNGRGQADRKGE
jgi:hypothetical protein